MIVRQMDEKYRKESTLAKNIRKDVYQAKLLNKEFAQLLKVFVILKINIKMLPQKPDANLLSGIFEKIARLGMIHPAFEPTCAT